MKTSTELATTDNMGKSVIYPIIYSAFESVKDKGIGDNQNNY